MKSSLCLDGACFALILPVLVLFFGCQGESSQSIAPEAQAVPFDSARAWKHLLKQVEFGPRPSGTEALGRTRDWIAKELTSYGLEVKREAFVAQTPGGPIEMENVYADLEGPKGRDGKPGPMIVLGSHFDTKNLPFKFVGANDAASNTGVLLELARVLSLEKGHAVTYRFLFFDGEESVRLNWVDPDNRYGSKHHVQQLGMVRGARQRIKAMINIDLVGDKDLQLENDSSSTQKLMKIFMSTAKSIGDPDLISKDFYPVEDDHESFIKAGIPSVDLIDLHFGEYANEYWHTAEDKVENCSEESLARVGKLVLAALPRVIKAYVK